MIRNRCCQITIEISGVKYSYGTRMREAMENLKQTKIYKRRVYLRICVFSSDFAYVLGYVVESDICT